MVLFPQFHGQNDAFFSPIGGFFAEGRPAGAEHGLPNFQYLSPICQVSIFY
jgi:hypothetical protein